MMRGDSLAIIGMAALLILSITAPVSYAKIDPETVVGVWLLDGIKEGMVRDISGNGHDGVVNGDPKVVQGRFGNALQFNGVSDFIDCGNDESLNLKTFTVTLWIYVPKTQYWNHIVSKGDHVEWGNPGSVNWGVMMVDGQSECLFEIYEDKGWTGIRGPIELKKWHHLAATYDGDKMEFFVDGVSQGSKTGVKIKLDPSRSFRIGAVAKGLVPPSKYFNGNIDEVAYFNVVLSQEDIESIMNNGLEQALSIFSVSPGGKLSTTWARVKR